MIRLIAISLLAIIMVLAGCGSAPDLTIQGPATGNTPVYSYDLEYWARADKSLAILMVYDSRDPKYALPLHYKHEHKDGKMSFAIFWTDTDAIYFDANHCPPAGTAVIVYAGAKTIQTKVTTPDAALALFRARMGRDPGL
jgi:uncharacterized protein YceK